MKTLLLILILAISAAAQSADILDYRTISNTRGATASIDLSSIEYRGDTPHFWLLLTVRPPSISVLLSVELNCRTRHARVWRTVLSGGYIDGRRSGWLRTNTARWDRAMLRYMCQ